MSLLLAFKQRFRLFRRKIIRWWRLHAVVPRLLRFNAYTGYIGRRLFHYIPFILPHDKSYYGLMHVVKPGDGLILDIGANDGISAIGFKHIHSDYRVFSIEPNLVHEPSLRRLTRKLKGFSFHIMGAGEKEESSILYVPYYRGVPIYTAASIDENFVRSSMQRQFKDNAEDVKLEKKIIPIIPLDSLDLTPQIIKMDTEGYDLSVLKGLLRTIQRCRPILLIEFNPKDFDAQKKILKDLGYEFYSYQFKTDSFALTDFQELKRCFEQTGEARNIYAIPQERVEEIPK